MRIAPSVYPKPAVGPCPGPAADHAPAAAGTAWASCNRLLRAVGQRLGRGRGRGVALLALSWLALSLALHGPAQAADPDAIASQAAAMARAGNAVVGVQALAVEGARSIASLGRLRQGSGVVIGPDDQVLTIGYLILEAEQVRVVLDSRRSVPARVVAYDVATGFGLLQPLAPLGIEPVPLARALPAPSEQPLAFVSGGAEGTASAVNLLSRRPFSGFWEYHIDGALFTGPARDDHSGAALFSSAGELLGIGSLVVADALGTGEAPRVPGNMFVPVDLLTPVLAELRQRGRSSASERAWLGVNCVEHAGSVRVVRVNDDSPADVAGLQPGDRIERIDGMPVAALDALWKALWSGGQPEREVTLDIRRGDELRTLKLQSVDRMKTLRRPEGI